MANPTKAIAKNEAPIIDTRSNTEVDAANLALMEESNQLDAASAAILASCDMLARITAIGAAKKEQFGKLEVDFWTPSEPGTPGAVIQGIYLGRAKMGDRLLQHAVAVPSSDGKRAVVVRLNGRAGLTNALKQCEPKDGVRIEYMGEKTSQGLVTGKGQKFMTWEVTRIPADKLAPAAVKA